MKKLVATFIIVIGFIVNTTTASGQGIYGCTIREGRCVNLSGPSSCPNGGCLGYCSSGYVQGNSCTGLSIQGCENTQDPRCDCLARTFSCVSSQQSGNTQQNENGATTNSQYCPLPGGGQGIDTAIGCIPITDQNALFGFFLSWGLGIAGGLAFLLIIFASFQIMTSSGDPKKMQAGKELLTAAISGVVLLIFSVFILRIIAGPGLLNIPFFNQ